MHKYFCDRCGNELTKDEEKGCLTRRDITGIGEDKTWHLSVRAEVVGSEVNHLCHKCVLEILNEGTLALGKYEQIR